MKAKRSYKKLYCSLLAPLLCAAVLFADQNYGNDDWQGFLESCTDETYAACNVTIDGESYHHAAIRAKGNTSLSNVAAYGNDRYSFKIEFDHYNEACRYHGLDKLSLNNIIQGKDLPTQTAGPAVWEATTSP